MPGSNKGQATVQPSVDSLDRDRLILRRNRPHRRIRGRLSGIPEEGADARTTLKIAKDGTDHCLGPPLLSEAKLITGVLSILARRRIRILEEGEV